MPPRIDRSKVGMQHRPLAKTVFFGSGLFFVILLGLALNISSCWAAPEMTELQALDFGTIAVRDNASVSTAKVSANGTPAYTGSILFVTAPTPGRYRISGLPPFVTVTPSLLAITAAVEGQVGGAVLTLSQPVLQPADLRTNAQGEVEFRLGASMTTSGNTTPYADGVYRAFPTLELDFSLDGELQTAKLDFSTAITLRSTFELTELQALNFGRIVALNTATDQASYTLQPNGATAVATPGTARLIRYGDSSPARIRVSGGAPFASISVTLPTETVLLTHTSKSADVAQLEVDNFTVLPVPGEIKLDANGVIDLRIGATLKTEQSNRRYADGEYVGTYSVTVNY